jgi:sulfur-carrier protein
MVVTVKIPTILRPKVGGSPTVEGSGATVREVLGDLEVRYPGFMEAIVTENGVLHRFVNLYVNDEDVRYLGALDTEVGEGDTVAILPAVAGGSIAPGWPRPGPLFAMVAYLHAELLASAGCGYLTRSRCP